VKGNHRLIDSMFAVQISNLLQFVDPVTRDANLLPWQPNEARNFAGSERKALQPDRGITCKLVGSDNQ
jgi:hypothetical protein